MPCTLNTKLQVRPAEITGEPARQRQGKGTPGGTQGGVYETASLEQPARNSRAPAGALCAQRSRRDLQQSTPAATHLIGGPSLSNAAYGLAVVKRSWANMATDARAARSRQCRSSEWRRVHWGAAHGWGRGGQARHLGQTPMRANSTMDATSRWRRARSPDPHHLAPAQ